jgi:hypothetical protein
VILHSILSYSFLYYFNIISQHTQLTSVPIQSNTNTNNNTNLGNQQQWPNPLVIPPEIVLTMNPDNYSVDNLPFGFPPPPSHPSGFSNIGSSLSSGYYYLRFFNSFIFFLNDYFFFCLRLSIIFLIIF